MTRFNSKSECAAFLKAMCAGWGVEPSPEHLDLLAEEMRHDEQRMAAAGNLMRMIEEHASPKDRGQAAVVALPNAPAQNESTPQNPAKDG